ncbi:class I SAM-dependent methyltransferase [Erythrobacter crassostreae]|uniref:Class I SAM-dependent methyltransferase n=1 Tax=Erythrobacter crassostreae TaxID=2828328 RepID=A0A9X1F2S7_9SPHN|nr:class I SAM-dependent methyltransferase [Erythrobacter crassostrea]MBV7259242.1 class I SAM-dependent methyltransferase [Erythrobacter crassostrea]
MSTLPTNAGQSQDAWGDFWALNARGNTSGEGGGCLPQRWAAIEQAQSGIWHELAECLPQGAKVLDLATGDGRVLAWMRSKRPDLALTGVDLSPTLPMPPTGTETRSGIAMEELPFAASVFDAVVSQFGFEYGDVPRVTAEIARVLAEGGKVGLIMHRGDGPILEHNRQRRDELLWPLKEKAVARKVKTALKKGPSAIDKAAEFAGKIAQKGAEKFGQQSPAWEIPEAIRRTCLMGRKSGVGSIVETIATIEGHAKNELGRIKSLSGACATADGRQTIVDHFAKKNLNLAETRSLKEENGREFADFVRFE